MMQSVKSIGELTTGHGMNEFVRDLWVSTVHCCGEVQQAMCDVTKPPEKVANMSSLGHPNAVEILMT